MNRTLYKSSSNKIICGVCGGIAEYFNLDPSIVRIVTAILSVCSGAGIIGYIVAAVVMPERTDGSDDIYDANYKDMQ